MAKYIPKLAGKIIDIDGPRVMFTRKFSTGSGGVFQAHIGLPVFLHDIFQTDKDTEMVIEFSVGGRAKVGRTERVLVKTFESLITVTSRHSDLYMTDLNKVKNFQQYEAKLALKVNPDFWSKFDKQKKEFEIKTTGGVLGGIEG